MKQIKTLTVEAIVTIVMFILSGLPTIMFDVCFASSYKCTSYYAQLEHMVRINAAYSTPLVAFRLLLFFVLSVVMCTAIEKYYK